MDNRVLLIDPTTGLGLIVAALTGKSFEAEVKTEAGAGYTKDYSPNYSFEEERLTIMQKQKELEAQLANVNEREAEAKMAVAQASQGEITPEMIALIVLSVNNGRICNYNEVPKELVSKVKYYLQKYQ